jgi:hypothetical protein
MEILRDLETNPIPFEEEERRHTRRLVIGTLVAVLITAVLLGGFAVGLLLYKRHNQEAALASAGDSKRRVALPPKVEVFVDAATIKEKETLLGGSVHNISNEPLRNLMIELEFKRRVTLDKVKSVGAQGGEMETRAIPLDVSELMPGASGRYAITVSAKDYVTASLIRVVAGDNRAEVPFKTLAGTPRPLETPAPGKTIVVKRPVPRGERFINTPDKPERVP